MSKHIVILGGSFAGISALKGIVEGLAKTNHKVTLITKDAFAFNNIAAPRALVEEEIVEKIVTPYDTSAFFQKHKDTLSLVVANIESVHRNHVIVKKQNSDASEQINFDIAVVALGTSYPFPYKPTTSNAQEWKDHLAKVRSELKTAKNVVIIGGGPVGVEVAGEIATDLPDIKVTLVHSQEKLMKYTSPKFSARLEEMMNKKNVKFLLNERVKDVNGGQIETKAGAQTVNLESGKSLDADYVFACTGGTPNSAPLKNGELSSYVNKGYLRVNEFLQVPDFPNIFALGDIADLAEVKLAANIRSHAPVLVANVLQYVLQPDTPLKKTYSVSNFKFAVATFGRNGGAMMVGSMVFGDWVTKNVKSKGLFADFISANLK
ncbi:Apoptosis-inducing factor 2 [Boothiomyces macroporosus]|uniref:Apoptosis-inducing factor 2 n=1 Tax=Boothiomyces macroporosus TaxID=261099 RepID=A0AAD5ULB9_9FUNG|nr:Apoptosis-inducing factor 2 [Boothiomyces macroporosus]